jgi:hypothetical protein
MKLQIIIKNDMISIIGMLKLKNIFISLLEVIFIKILDGLILNVLKL